MGLILFNIESERSPCTNLFTPRSSYTSVKELWKRSFNLTIAVCVRHGHSERLKLRRGPTGSCDDLMKITALRTRRPSSIFHSISCARDEMFVGQRAGWESEHACRQSHQNGERNQTWHQTLQLADPFLPVTVWKALLLKTLIKICLFYHSKWHLTRLVIFQLTAKTFLWP